MNRPAVKDMPDTGKKYPVVEYDDEAVEYIKAEGLENELEEALQRVPRYFRNTESIRFEIVEGSDEDSVPHLIMFVKSDVSTSAEFRTAANEFIMPLRQTKTKLYFALSILLG